PEPGRADYRGSRSCDGSRARDWGAHEGEVRGQHTWPTPDVSRLGGRKPASGLASGPNRRLRLYRMGTVGLALGAQRAATLSSGSERAAGWPSAEVPPRRGNDGGDRRPTRSVVEWDFLAQAAVWGRRAHCSGSKPSAAWRAHRVRLAAGPTPRTGQDTRDRGRTRGACATHHGGLEPVRAEHDTGKR